MQNDLFDGIEVPKTDVVHAIKSGIRKGKNVKRSRQRTQLTKKFAMIGSTAAASILAAGLVFAPIGNVLAQVPYVGEYYQLLHMPVGVEMASEQLVTEINESVTANGVTMTVTSAFYDGHFLGMTFKATGDNLTEYMATDEGPEAGYSYDLFKHGDDTDEMGATMSSLTKEGNAYVGAVIFQNSDLKDLKNLAITFTWMAGVTGEWKFDVPVESTPSTQVTLNQLATSVNDDYTVEFSDVVVNKVSVIVNYSIQKQAGIEGEELFFRTKVKNEDGYASLSSQDDTSLVLEKGVDTQLIILEPYFKVDGKEINLSPVELELK